MTLVDVTSHLSKKQCVTSEVPRSDLGVLLLSSTTVDLLDLVHDVEEPVLLVLVPLVHVRDGSITLHEVPALSEQHYTVLLLCGELELLLNDGENLGYLEGAGHEELGVCHLLELLMGVLVLGALDDQGELVGVLLLGFSCPLGSLF